MTEEAFIRAVLDRPGEDTPRLVYADWLDDHAAPDRAAYLRAEAEWAAPWRAGVQPTDPAELRGAADRLDPLWVARMSRPPLGVCCEHFLLEDSGPELCPEDLARVESEFGFTFPVGYAAFLLNWNGGRPYPTAVWLPSSAQFSDEYVHRFYSVAVAGDQPPGCLQARIARYRATLPRYFDQSMAPSVLREWYTNQIPVAETPEPGCEELLAVRGATRGSISWFDWSSDLPGPGAAFSSHLAAFRPPAEFVISEAAWDDPRPDDPAPPQAAGDGIPF